MLFDGIGDYIQIPENSAFTVETVTVTAWVKGNVSRESYVLSKGSETPYSVGTRGGTSGQGEFRMRVGSSINDGKTTQAIATTKADGQWHHIAGVYDGATAKIYVDGELEGQTTQTAGLGTVDHPVSIGIRDLDKSGAFAGVIDEVRVYNNALSQAEIQALCNCGEGGGTTIPIEEFVQIDPGTYQMGSTGFSSDEQPVHSVTISESFYLQKTEVTQAQWAAVMGSNPSQNSSCGNLCPVENVSWTNIQAFIQALNAADPSAEFRLPTEAEWEYAARAGTTGDYGGTGVLSQMGWYDGNGGGTIHPVAQKTANAWGLYDMHGNVWEWVQDWYSPSYYSSSPSTDPTGPTSGSTRVMRGGSWNHPAAEARSANRQAHTPGSRYETVGLRLVRKK
jgi:formylglycine-generating enzyme required for sulfatase activity